MPAMQLDLYSTEGPTPPSAAVIVEQMAAVYEVSKLYREAWLWRRKALAVGKVCPTDTLAMEAGQASQTLRHWNGVLRAAKARLDAALRTTGVPSFQGGGYEVFYRLAVRPDGREQPILIVRNVAEAERQARRREERKEQQRQRDLKNS